MYRLSFICSVLIGFSTGQDAFAQSLKHDLQTSELIVAENAVASPMADCYAGQTVNPGENCTYPGTSGVFEVASSGSARLAVGNLTYQSGPGGSINAKNLNVGGRTYNFVAKGQSDGSWFLEEVGSDVATPGATVIYDSGSNDDSIFVKGASDNIMAQRYDVPSGASLASVMVAPVYDNQFMNSSVLAGAPRDFTLKIWNVAGDGSPGAELYSMDVDEATNASHVNNALAYSFLQVDVPANEPSLATLPDRIFIGLANKGTDDNYLIFATSRREDNAPADVAYSHQTIGSDTGWYTVTSLRLLGMSLANQVFPIRPRFLASQEPVSADDPGELPSGVKLAQNYPNPFNPSTTVTYALDRAGSVEMSVYDMTGRIVQTLVDGMRPAGNHEVRFDAGGLPTGTYLYRLRVGTETLTETMTFVR